ncbi:hypothetical protein [Segatella bryantii]|uniref:hypothetical protein n=1 Tax=Segatella bryantii TaxID=77095 RepID=UPI00285338B5|nr:hypothetical protein [Segatella bryantii]MDR4931330.1 hypothetical protein [Segatella bryantii]
MEIKFICSNNPVTKFFIFFKIFREKCIMRMLLPKHCKVSEVWDDEDSNKPVYSSNKEYTMTQMDVKIGLYNMVSCFPIQFSRTQSEGTTQRHVKTLFFPVLHFCM